MDEQCLLMDDQNMDRQSTHKPSEHATCTCLKKNNMNSAAKKMGTLKNWPAIAWAPSQATLKYHPRGLAGACQSFSKVCCCGSYIAKVCSGWIIYNHLYHLHFPADSSATPKFVFVRSTSSAVPSYHTATVRHGPFGKPSLCQRTVVVLCVAGLHSNVVFESLCGIDNNQHNEHKNKTHLK